MQLADFEIALWCQLGHKIPENQQWLSWASLRKLQHTTDWKDFSLVITAVYLEIAVKVGFFGVGEVWGADTVEKEETKFWGMLSAFVICLDLHVEETETLKVLRTSK